MADLEHQEALGPMRQATTSHHGPKTSALSALQDPPELPGNRDRRACPETRACPESRVHMVDRDQLVHLVRRARSESRVRTVCPANLEHLDKFVPYRHRPDHQDCPESKDRPDHLEKTAARETLVKLDRLVHKEMRDKTERQETQERLESRDRLDWTATRVGYVFGPFCLLFSLFKLFTNRLD